MLKGLIRGLFDVEFQPPTDLPRTILTKLGYFRLRTWLAAHGEVIPGSALYQPLYSPWAGEPVFEEIYRRVKPHTLVSRDRCFVLWKTLQQALLLPGDVIECGVFRGGTALLEATVIQASGKIRPHHLFDTFEGMLKTAEGIDRFEVGDLSATSVEAVGRLVAPYPFTQIHAGLIPATFNRLSLDRVCWAHVDVDLYQSVRDSIDYIYPRLVPGGYLIMDDYGFPSCAGARRAVDESFESRPEVPLCLPTGQCLVVKLGS